MHHTNLFMTGLLVLGLSMTMVLPVSAESNRSNEARESTETKREEKKNEEKKQLLAMKLTDNKKKVCEKRLGTIQKIMARTNERGSRQLEVFTKIADRTQTFYVEKQYSVTNYDDLVAAVEEKKQAATIAVAMSSETIGQFTCDGEDPLAIKDLFKAQVQDQNQALKIYKTAVKDLIVAVKSSKSQSTPDTSTPTSNEENQ